MNHRELIEQVCMGDGEPYRDARLSRADWLSVALDVLIDSGIDSVRITQLAKSLGVTRGSFYWHFKNRAEILDAIIQVWERKNTARIVSAAKSGSDLESCVLSIFETWLDPEKFDPKLDFAVRDWARGDKKLQDLISCADRERLKVLANMFLKYGFDKQQSEIRARNLYYTQMGYYALNVKESLASRLNMLPTYFETYTGQKLNRITEKEFRKKIISRHELWEGEERPEL